MLRVPGTAVFLNRNKVTAPLAMRASVDHLHALNEHVVILSIETLPVPHVPRADRLVIDDLGYTDDGITHASARFGYMDAARTCPAVLRQHRAGRHRVPARGRRRLLLPLHDRPPPRRRPGMSRWRKSLFLATSRITADAAEYFGLPRDRTVIIGLTHRGLAAAEAQSLVARLTSEH